MTYRTNISNPHFSLKFSLLQAAIKKLGGALDSPSGDNFIWRLSIDGKCSVFFGQTFPLNTASAWRLAQDKLATYQVLESFGVRVPKGVAYFRPKLGSKETHVEHNRLIESLREQLRSTFTEEFSKPDALFVVKPGEECGGLGVRLCVGIDEALSYSPDIFQWGHYGVVQEFVPGSEWRVFVLKGAAVLTYQRQSSTESAIQNLSQGAHPIVSEDPPANVIETALRATNLLGLGFSGVDLRLPPDGDPVVLEVNGNPGFLLFREFHPLLADKLIDLLATALVDFVREHGFVAAVSK